MPQVPKPRSAASVRSSRIAGASPSRPGVVASVSARLRDLGLDQPAKPEDRIPSLPRDLGELSDRKLVEHMQAFTAWADYLNVQVAVAEIDEADLEFRWEMVKARIMAGAPKGEVNKARAFTKVEPQAADLAAEHATAKAYRKMVTALSENCQRDAALLSRELTRRTTIVPQLGTVARRRP